MTRASWALALKSSDYSESLRDEGDRGVKVNWLYGRERELEI